MRHLNHLESDPVSNHKSLQVIIREPDPPPYPDVPNLPLGHEPLKCPRGDLEQGRRFNLRPEGGHL